MIKARPKKYRVHGRVSLRKFERDHGVVTVSVPVFFGSDLPKDSAAETRTSSFELHEWLSLNTIGWMGLQSFHYNTIDIIQISKK